MGTSPKTPTIGDHLLRLFESKEGADVTFQVEQSEFAAHTLVLARLPRHVLRRAAKTASSRGRLREAPRADRRHGRRGLRRAPPLRLRRRAASTGRNRRSGELLRAANRYGLDRMRFLCEKALREAVVDAALVLADRHGCAELKAFCVEYVARPEVLRRAVRTEGYAEQKASHPVVVAEILEQLAAGFDKEEEERRASVAMRMRSKELTTEDEEQDEYLGEF
ncbi:hypothetical protein QOZ80_2BG0158100 [Eleusine coracana subsp. coracana]|nr:hypothetical protein QOZ80_2BG0158100 [Eleusine coracana subsp. coracana]